MVTVKHQAGLQSSEDSARLDIQNVPVVWLAPDARHWLGIQLGLVTCASASGLFNMVVSRWSDFLERENQVKLHGFFFFD